MGNDDKVTKPRAPPDCFRFLTVEADPADLSSASFAGVAGGAAAVPSRAFFGYAAIRSKRIVCH